MTVPRPALETFRIRRVMPSPEIELTAMIDGHDLVFASDAGELDRYNLAEIAFEGTAGEFLWFGYKGSQNLLAVADAEPMAFVEALLDARSRARRDPLTQWSVGEVASPVVSQPPIPMLPDTPREVRRVDLPDRRMSTASFFGLAVIVLIGALVVGRLIGDLVNDASAVGVGDSVEVGSAIVIRDVSGVGQALLDPFSSAKDWRLDWENIGLSETDLTVTAVRTDGSETTLVAAEPIGRGQVGPYEPGSIRLRVESAGSWRLIVLQDD